MVNKKKITERILISLIIVIFSISLVLLNGCSTTIPNNSKNTTLNNESNISDIITITNMGFFSQEECAVRGFENKVIMFESKYCSHCKQTLPIFISACAENNITPEILDLSKTEHLEKMEEYNLQIKFTPTFIFGCNYFVGGLSKQEYIDKINEMNLGDING